MLEMSFTPIPHRCFVSVLSCAQAKGIFLWSPRKASKFLQHLRLADDLCSLEPEFQWHLEGQEGILCGGDTGLMQAIAHVCIFMKHSFMKTVFHARLLRGITYVALCQDQDERAPATLSSPYLARPTLAVAC